MAEEQDMNDQQNAPKEDQRDTQAASALTQRLVGLLLKTSGSGKY